MLSSEVVAGFAGVDAALDAVAEVDLSGLDPQDLLHLAALTEKTLRRLTVTSHDVSLYLSRSRCRRIGGAPAKVLADWLRISPAEARRRARVAEPCRAHHPDRRIAGTSPAGHGPGLAVRGSRR